MAAHQRSCDHGGVTGVALLALGSALLHAGWNLNVKASRDPFVFTWAIFASSTVVGIPILVALGWPAAEAWPFLLGSSLLQLAYAFTLSAAYRATDLSVAYPIARGLAPMLVTIGAWIALDDVLSVVPFLGVLLVSLSLMVIARGSGGGRGIGMALLTGFIISAYTLIDTAGVRRVDESIRYVATLFVSVAVLSTVAVFLTRPRSLIVELVRGNSARMLMSGSLAIGAYGLVLIAARLGPIGLVASLRETSVIFGTLFGWLVLKEPLGSRRTASAIGVALGAALLLIG